MSTETTKPTASPATPPPLSTSATSSYDNATRVQLLREEMTMVKPFSGSRTHGDLSFWLQHIKGLIDEYRDLIDRGVCSANFIIKRCLSEDAFDWFYTYTYSTWSTFEADITARYCPDSYDVFKAFRRLKFQSGSDVTSFLKQFEHLFKAAGGELSSPLALSSLYDCLSDENLIYRVRSRYPKSYQEASRVLQECSRWEAAPTSASHHGSSLESKMERLASQFEKMSIHLAKLDNTRRDESYNRHDNRDRTYGPRHNNQFNNNNNNNSSSNYNNSNNKHYNKNTNTNPAFQHDQNPATANVMTVVADHDTHSMIQDHLESSELSEQVCDAPSSVNTVTSTPLFPIETPLIAPARRPVQVDQNGDALMGAPPVGPRRAEPIDFIPNAQSNPFDDMVERLLDKSVNVSARTLFTCCPTFRESYANAATSHSI